MQHFSRWRNVFTFNSATAQSARNGIASISPTAHLASFHSTSFVLEKWRNKFNIDVGGDRQPSKTYVRYIVKQRRSDTKKALKSILYNGGCSTSRPESFSKIEADFADQLNKKSRTKTARQAKRSCQKKLKRKHQREDSYCDFGEERDSYGNFEGTERVFHATFGKRGFSWTFRPSEMGFDWTQSFGWTYSGFNEQNSSSRIEYDTSCYIGTYEDRKILGLPTAGPLKLEDVKTAYRLSALKWHPDKHQGPSQASAEEKFKQCAKAYKSLCNALSEA